MSGFCASKRLTRSSQYPWELLAGGVVVVRRHELQRDVPAGGRGTLQDTAPDRTSAPAVQKPPRQRWTCSLRRPPTTPDRRDESEFIYDLKGPTSIRFHSQSAHDAEVPLQGLHVFSAMLPVSVAEGTERGTPGRIAACPPLVTLAVLFAAVMHAGWNALAAPNQGQVGRVHPDRRLCGGHRLVAVLFSRCRPPAPGRTSSHRHCCTSATRCS